jgi:collagen type I alpha
MSTKKAKIVVMVALAGATFVVACGSGSDPVITLGSPYEQRAGDFAKATTSNQDPSPAQQGSAGGVATTNPQDGNGQDGDGGRKDSGTIGTSGGTSGNTSGGTSGNTSGGTSGMMAGCPQCDGSFTCDVTVTGSPTQKTTVMLVTKGGACSFSTQSGDIVFACGGALTSSGQNVGTWANCSKATVTAGPDAG